MALVLNVAEGINAHRKPRGRHHQAEKDGETVAVQSQYKSRRNAQQRINLLRGTPHRHQHRKQRTDCETCRKQRPADPVLPNGAGQRADEGQQNGQQHQHQCFHSKPIPLCSSSIRNPEFRPKTTFTAANSIVTPTKDFWAAVCR